MSGARRRYGPQGCTQGVNGMQIAVQDRTLPGRGAQGIASGPRRSAACPWAVRAWVGALRLGLGNDRQPSAPGRNTRPKPPTAQHARASRGRDHPLRHGAPSHGPNHRRRVDERETPPGASTPQAPALSCRRPVWQASAAGQVPAPGPVVRALPARPSGHDRQPCLPRRPAPTRPPAHRPGARPGLQRAGQRARTGLLDSGTEVIGDCRDRVRVPATRVYRSSPLRPPAGSRARGGGNLRASAWAGG